MKKLLIEGVIIFSSIISSLSLENYRQESEQKNILKESILTLTYEINENINYTEEHLYQLKNLKLLNQKIIADFENIDIKRIYDLHKTYPFIHSIDIDGEVKYMNDFPKDFGIVMFISWLAWEPADIFFQSMLYSGKLLEIKDNKLRTEIESIYTKHEESVTGMTQRTEEVSNEINKWFKYNRDLFANDITFDEVFMENKNRKLKNLLSEKNDVINARISSLQFYLKSLKNLNENIKSEYQK